MMTSSVVTFAPRRWSPDATQRRRPSLPSGQPYCSAAPLGSRVASSPTTASRRCGNKDARGRPPASESVPACRAASRCRLSMEEFKGCSQGAPRAQASERECAEQKAEVPEGDVPVMSESEQVGDDESEPARDDVSAQAWAQRDEQAG